MAIRASAGMSGDMILAGLIRVGRSCRLNEDSARFERSSEILVQES
jgi:uncharacterized protein (DUF111 family)